MLAQRNPTSPTESLSTVLRGGVKMPTSSTSASSELSLDDPHERGDAAVRVVPGVEEKGLQGRLRIALRGRDTLDDSLEQLVDASPQLRGSQHRVVRRDADDLLDLLARPLGLRRRQIDLVDDRHDREVVVDGQVRVGEGLRLDALCRVHDQDRPLASRQRSGDLVGKVHVAGSVDQVQRVVGAVPGAIGQRDRARLDRDAALLLELHVVEHLLVHLTRRNGAAPLEQAVRQRRLAVIDVRDDGEVANQGWVCHGRTGDISRLVEKSLVPGP